MTEGLFCSFFTEERMDMKNNIAVQIGSGYGDLRKSEKQAADYILNHMEEAAELPKTGGAGHGRESDLMYGYTLDKSTPLEEIPVFPREKDLLPPYVTVWCEPETIAPGDKADILVRYDPEASSSRMLNVVPVILTGLSLPPTQRTIKVVFSSERPEIRTVMP